MNPALRRILGVLAGLGVALVIIFGVEAINGAIYPLPGLLLGVTILNLISVPHPVWFWIPAVLIWPPGIALGVTLALQ